MTFPTAPISIHALREEGDLRKLRILVESWLFLSTPSARRATLWQALHTHNNGYFYPRPPRGGRLVNCICSNPRSLFLSTPSARRATGLDEELLLDDPISIHALREEGDPEPDAAGLLRNAISIHALREEGDIFVYEVVIMKRRFLSTPSARRAT